MKIHIIKSAATGLKGLEVIHNDETIEFRAKNKIHCGRNDVDLYIDVNRYFELLDKDTLDEIFECFKAAKGILNPSYFGVAEAPAELLRNSRDYEYLIKQVRPHTDRILELIKPRNFMYFCRSNGLCKPPKGLQETINRGEYASEMTFNPEEYGNTAEFALLLRPIFPIISETIQKVKEITGDDYKEVVTGELLKGNPTIMGHPGWIKINSYVKNFYSQKGINPLQLSVISEESYVNHAVWIAIFTRLCCAHIPTQNEGKDLAKSMYSIVKQFDSGSSNIREKKASGRDEQNEKRSLYEIYHLREDVPATQIEAAAEFFTMKHYTHDDKPIYKDRYIHQCKAMGIKDPLMVDKVYELLPRLCEFELEPHILQLLEVVFVDHVPYALYPYLDYEQLKSAMALATVWLAENGYENLAAIPLSFYNPTGDRYNTDGIFDLNTAEREHLLTLCGVYRNKEDISTDNELVANAIDFLKALGNNPWLTYCEPGMLKAHDVIDSALTGETYEIELDRSFKEEFYRLIVQQNT